MKGTVNRSYLSGATTKLERASASIDTPQSKRTAQLTDQQRCRLFACLCVARHVHGASDNDDTFSMDIYEETLALMEPFLQPLGFEEEPSYITVWKLWKDFLRTGVVVAPKLKAKLGPKGSRLAKGDDEPSCKRDLKSLMTKYSVWGLVIVCLFMPLILNLIDAQEPHNEAAVKSPQLQHELKLRSHIDEIKTKYATSLMPKHFKTIRARLDMMKREVSVLLLLGRSHDIHCKVDKTFCVGQAIANITQYPQFGYIDARDARLDSNDLTAELSEVLDERNDVMMIDSLDRLPGSEVMSLFQFIDRDEMNKRRKGLLLLLMYTGSSNLDNDSLASMRDAEIVERLLVPRWSQYVKGDTLTSVISRISGTIVRVQ